METQETYRGRPVTRAYDAKIDSLVSEMTLEEKVGMLHGTSMFTTAGVQRLGIPVHVLMGSYDNIKITTREDLLFAEAILKGRQGS